METVRKTPFNPMHRELNARLVDFAGWEMPVWYTSILEEHRAVRTGAGMFDTSHMGRVWVSGGKAGAFLDRVVTRPAQRLSTGMSQLCLLCREDGGILDDLFIYRLSTAQYLIIWNAGHQDVKLDWLKKWAGNYPDIIIDDRSAATVMLAVQGPAVPGLKSLTALAALPRFGSTQVKIGGIDCFAGRTGYTGEDGFEIISEAKYAEPLWRLFLSEGVKPCGLGARDSLRLEAGMLLYGQDMDTGTNPFKAGLDWLVDLNSADFIGKNALLRIKSQGVKRKLAAFKMLGREIPRHGYAIAKSGQEVGRVTSGGFSPTLGIGIGLGYVPTELSGIGTDIDILIRNQPALARVNSRRFYKRGA